MPAPAPVPEERFENASAQYEEPESPDNDTVVSESLLDEQEMLHSAHYAAGSRKRKRGADQMSLEDQQHQIWADSLLDYFMLLESEDRFPAPPDPPPNVNLDRPIDEKGHSAIHWAAAMGDVDVVKDLLRRGARTDCLSNNLETPLMRAVMFTNNYDKNTMPSMVKIFQQTVVRTDWFGSTVFHHIAATTSSTNKYACARYYLDCIINRLSETWIPDEITRLLNVQDKNGDTAVHIAARNGARKCVRSLLGRNVAVDLLNHKGETTDELIRDLNERRRHVRPRQASSSPFAPDPRVNGDAPLLTLPSSNSALVLSTPQESYHSQTATHLMQKIAPTLLEKCGQLASAYEAELEEKEVESADAERVKVRREAEINAIRRQVLELEELVNEMDVDVGADDMKQEEELARLVRDSEALLEVEQRAEMRRHRALAEQRAMGSSVGESILNEQPTSDSLRERLQLAIMLHKAQDERQALVRQVVQALSVAGMGERTAEYKRLIVGALGVREEDVEGMVPEILSELEEAQEREVLERGVGVPRQGIEDAVMVM
jgi:transcription factor MBP1